jgi:DNA repair protein RAD50
LDRTCGVSVNMYLSACFCLFGCGCFSGFSSIFYCMYKFLFQMLVKPGLQIYEQALGPAKREKERIELEHLEFKKAKTDEENRCLQELNTFGKEADKLKNTAATVHKFVLSRKDEQLRAVNERLLRKKVEQEEKTAQLNSMQKEYATLKGLIGNQAELKRKIDDNLQYRETRNKEEQMREQIEHLEQQLVSKGELSVLEAGLKRVLSELQSLLSEVISFF